MIKKHIHGPIDYSKITPLIYIGTNMCSYKSCNIHFRLLKKLGIYADISLEEERSEQPHYLKAHLWLPTKDKAPPSTTQLLVGVSALKQLEKHKKKVYVHCKHGHGRSPTLVAAYLITKGYTALKAIKLLKTKRPEIHITRPQVSAIKNFEKYYKNNKKLINKL